MAGSLLGPVVARLAREQVGGQVEPPAPLLAADPESFSDLVMTPRAPKETHA
jgi:hypothetical protein